MARNKQGYGGILGKIVILCVALANLAICQSDDIFLAQLNCLKNLQNLQYGTKNAKISQIFIKFLRNLMRFICAILLCSALFADNQNAKNSRQDFLTLFEYGKALYKNPRGIGCIKCHGDNAEGAVISEIRQNGKAKNIAAPDIRGVNFIKFESALKNPKGVMPSYNLTSSELIALYKFLNPNFKPPK